MLGTLFKQTRTATPTSGEQKKNISSYTNPRISLGISLLWLPCMFLFSRLKNRRLQRLLLNETMDVSSWNVDHVLKTAWKWSSWSFIWEQDGTNVSFISHIRMRFLSCVILVLLFCRRCQFENQNIKILEFPCGLFTALESCPLCVSLKDFKIYRRN